MNTYIDKDHVVYDCGCKFKILDYGPPIRIEFNPDIEEINIECEATWDLISSGNTKGIFQLESGFGQQYAKKLKPHSIEHLAALSALLRPGCLNNRDEDGCSVTDLYIDIKDGLKEAKIYHESLEPILSNTYMQMIYQEQAMKIAQEVAGFNLQQADTLRKCVTGDTMFVSKTRGWISINKLLSDGYENDLFLVMDENGKQEWKKIEKIWSTGKHDVNNICPTSGLGVKATKYHQFLTSNGWKARMRLIEDDYLICAREIEYDGEDKISSDLAFIIAGILTEGHFVEDNGTFVNYDERLMSLFTYAFKNVFNRNKSGNNPNVFHIHKSEREYLNKYMGYGLSGDKFIPDEMMGMTKSSTARFLSFMFAAECGITKSSGQVEYSSKSKKMIEQIYLLLLRFGIRSYIREKIVDEKLYYRLYINDVRDQEKLYKHLSDYWPKYKQDDLKYLLENKHKNYSTDIVPPNITKSLIDQYPYVGRFESGSIYSQNITRERFNRLADIAGDPYWQNLSNGKQQYLKIMDMSQKHRQQVTYDFTIEGNDTPYIIANGIVIHNSIGKKLAKLMAKVKSEFIAGCLETKVVTPEQAEEIFGWIEKSQRYSFNKCLSPNSKVTTQNGIKLLRDIQVGDKVLSLNNKFVDVLDVIHNGKRHLYEVKFCNGERLICTVEHKLLCEDNKLYTLDDVFLNKRKVITKYTNSSIFSVEYYDYNDTMDIEVDSHEHVFYANNIAVSNSHAVAYAHVSYLSAYEKTHFPLSFFTSYLWYAKDKQNKFDEIKLLVGNAKLMGIDIMPPDFRHTNCHFAEIPNKLTSKEYDPLDGKVFFGFADIKGIGEKKIVKLNNTILQVEAMLEKHRKEWTWTEYLVFFSQGIDSTTNNGMIESGALDYMKVSRTKMLFEYDIYSKLTKKEQAWIQQNVRNYGSLEQVLSTALIQHEKFTNFKTAKKPRKGKTLFPTEIENNLPKTKFCSNKNRVLEVESLIKKLKNPSYTMNDSIDWIARIEEARLGIPLTATVLDSCKNLDHANCTITDFKNRQESNSAVFIACQVDDIKVHIDKNGSEMAFLSVFDNENTLDCVIFKDTWLDQNIRNLCIKNNAIILSGDRSKTGGLVVKKIWQLV